MIVDIEQTAADNCNMAEVFPPESQHDQFTAWAKEQGVKINGVGPAKISGRGLGIIAQRRIEVQTPIQRLSTNRLNLVLGW